jgi:hypothetical protein
MTLRLRWAFEQKRVHYLLATLVCLAGCQGGSDRPPRGNVAGQVTFAGKPVTEGQVNFYSSQTGFAAAAPIGPEGKYEIPGGIEAGAYQVYISPPPSDVPAGAPVTAPPKEYPDIPQKYRSDATSGLTAEVETGDNTFNFDMQP